MSSLATPPQQPSPLASAGSGGGGGRRPRGPSLSGRSESSAGGDDAVAVAVVASSAGAAADDREAIRARDKRERDLAVQQRRNMDLSKGTGKARKVNDAREATHRQQQHQQRDDGQERKETEKVCTLTRLRACTAWEMRSG